MYLDSVPAPVAAPPHPSQFHIAVVQGKRILDQLTPPSSLSDSITRTSGVKTVRQLADEAECRSSEWGWRADCPQSNPAGSGAEPISRTVGTVDSIRSNCCPTRSKGDAVGDAGAGVSLQLRIVLIETAHLHQPLSVTQLRNPASTGTTSAAKHSSDPQQNHKFSVALSDLARRLVRQRCRHCPSLLPHYLWAPIGPSIIDTRMTHFVLSPCWLSASLLIAHVTIVTAQHVVHRKIQMNKLQRRFYIHGRKGTYRPN
ncbi:hypothetical protein BLNAU_3867 [Blattamonas nauphoetae]|uniref:Uncharacterized protein n=1 Tax=Blattamonas nauphoetae TaxID=2049346 RepID=A0ABQ9YBW8_9EUKA|nr:hypothetical protein BLNAU_23113 [Blattamonas nauphoetae]KAK2961099.1 hypothetical protein BLNAU_3867 [Blattamonas nauphoetae]